MRPAICVPLACALLVAALGLPRPVLSDGPYLALRGGPNFVPDLSASIGGLASLDVDLATGFDLGIAGGYRFDGAPFGSVRLEGEVAYQRHEVADAALRTREIPLIDLSVTDAAGTGTVTSLMANIYADLELHDRIVPFVGVGAGAAWATLDDVGGRLTASIPVVGDVSISGTLSDSSQTLAAIQSMAGFAVRLSDRAEVGIGYRAFLTSRARFETRIPVINQTERIEGNIFSQSMRLELRYRFAD